MPTVNGPKCPCCGTAMEYKALLPIDMDQEGRGGYEIFQCPKCKNIEVKE